MGVVGSHEVTGSSRVKHFTRQCGLNWDPIALKISQKVAKSLANNVGQWSGDFQQGGCLFKPTSVILRTTKHLWMYEMPQKAAPVKADQIHFGTGTLVVYYWWSYQLAMKTVLCHCVCMWRVLANLVTYAYAYICIRDQTNSTYILIFKYSLVFKWTVQIFF